MRILIACEFSGTVRDEFLKRGHDAWSCDIIDCDKGPARHIKDDVRNVLKDKWDIIIAHPPCTNLCVSGARWWKDKGEECLVDAIGLVMSIWNSDCEKVVIENPVGRLSSLWMKPSQIIHPWQHGHGETKKTCLWIRGLPLLVPRNIVSGRDSRIHHMPPGVDRWKSRSKTYIGIARSMAMQWGN